MKKTKKNKELELEIIYGELFDKMVECTGAGLLDLLRLATTL